MLVTLSTKAMGAAVKDDYVADKVQTASIIVRKS